MLDRVINKDKMKEAFKTEKTSTKKTEQQEERDTYIQFIHLKQLNLIENYNTFI